jgi:hypothetical protein
MSRSRRHLLVHRLLSVVAALLLAAPASAKQLIEHYPGKVLRAEEVMRESNPYVLATFVDVVDSCPVFRFDRLDRQVIFERPVHEKIRVTRMDQVSRGISEVVHGEFMVGTMTHREEVVRLGPLPGAAFSYLGTSSVTNDQGLLIDRAQKVLALFEDRREKEAIIVFESDEHGRCQYQLERPLLDEKLGIHFGRARGQMCPEALTISQRWDRRVYNPGMTAELEITASNSGRECTVFQLQALSMSRHPWLDGRMFYFGDIPAGETRTFRRVFVIPESAAAGIHFQRIGLKDISGRKPQLSVTLTIKKEQTAAPEGAAAEKR